MKKFAHHHDVNKPSLPRKRKPRTTIENYFSTTESDHPETAEDEYRMKYFEAIDLIVSCIEHGFDQDDFEMYALCGELLVKAAIKRALPQNLKKLQTFALMISNLMP